MAGVIFTAAAAPVSTPVGRYFRRGDSHHRSVSTRAMSTRLIWPWWNVLCTGSIHRASGRPTSAQRRAAATLQRRSVSTSAHHSEARLTASNNTHASPDGSHASGVKNSAEDGG